MQPKEAVRSQCTECLQAATRMEFLRRLHECNERRLSFRQAFFALGMVNDSKPLRQLNDEETFSTLINWAMHKLPSLHSMILRINVDGAIYQTVIRKSIRQIRVGKLTRLAGPGAIGYDWPEDTRYESLDISTIEKSAFRANIINTAKERGCEPTNEELAQQVEEQAAGMSWEIPKITMRQTQENCWEVVLTEEERELIDEFLET